ncbi:DUF2505 domain-containing protein [Brevibacterium marinum]|uniref:DUF2505 domain-containing protein n=1 Tax=Brevibacterium marinum TaxID=418643 RepID=A0A846SA16_9MICO|nr:DUF2505 domain-containing protein [Brevibacterium marinum]NJC57637.1 hypothetical protein [Brevibacterium marinum]
MQRAELKRKVALGPAQILDVLADEDTWRADGASVEILSGRADGLQLTATMPLARDQLPATAQSFLGADAKVVQNISSEPVSESDDASTVNIDAEIPGVAIDVHVEISLIREAEDCTDLHALIEIVSSLPFFGRAIESGTRPHIQAMISTRFGHLPTL